MSLPQRTIAVVGAGYLNRDGSNRQFAIRMCDLGEQMELRPEPRNKHDERAVAVFSARGKQIGYLPAERSPQIVKMIGEGREVRAVFQEETEFGAAIRVAFDGDEPVLPERRAEEPPVPVGDPDTGFWPDEDWTYREDTGAEK